jgi:hypothetical protein
MICDGFIGERYYQVRRDIEAILSEAGEDALKFEGVYLDEKDKP